MSNPETPGVIQPKAEPASMSPQTRFVRTLLQLALAVCGAVPAAVWLIPHMTAGKAAQIVGITAAIAAFISALHNGVNAATTKKAG